MFSKIESFIASRYLRSKRKEIFISIITIISILGVAISVVVLNITLGIMTGLEAELQKKLVDANAHILVREFGGGMRNYDKIIDKIKGIKNIDGVTPYTQNQAMISSKRGAVGIIMRGVNDDKVAREKISKMIAGEVKGKDIIAEDDRSQILFEQTGYMVTRPDGEQDLVNLPPLLIGESLAQNIGVRVGEPITVIAPTFSASPQGAIPKLRRFLVTGIYSSGLKEYENGVVYTSLNSAQQFFDLSGSIYGLEIFVQEMLKADDIALKIDATINPEMVRYNVLTWKDLNRPLWEALKLEKQVYFIVLLLLIMIASFSIVSTLVMVVMEKGKDIAILKSMGMSDASVLKIFLLQGIIIGAVGTVLGTILGYLGCLGLRAYGFPLNPAVFSVDTVPVYIISSNFLIVAISAFLITSISGIYPARRASRLNTADVLRYE